MKEKIGKNYFLAVVVGGRVVANYYTNSLVVVTEMKRRHPGCEVEVYDVSRFGFSFGDAPMVRVEGGIIHHGIRCIDTGQTWQSARDCCEEIGVPLKTLYTAVRRGSRVYGRKYEYCKH